MEAARQVVSTSPTEALPALAGPLSGSNDAVAAMRAAIASLSSVRRASAARTAARSVTVSATSPASSIQAVISAAIFVVVSLGVDLLYPVLDPRIRRRAAA